MHSYLRAVGYSNIVSEADCEKLVKKIMQDRSTSIVTEDADMFPIREYTYECAENVGVTVRCEIDTDPVEESETPVRVINYFPFLHGVNISTNEAVTIARKLETRAYTGMCDDGRLGVSLIFYLLNAVDYLNSRNRRKGDALSPVMLSALSLNGKILLPTVKNVSEPIDFGRNDEKHARLVADAQKGDPVAIESLTRENMDLYASVMDRARREDILSIVNTTFIPYGAESDVYTIIGEIEDLHEVMNKDTGEALCLMTLNCNDLHMDVCINHDDLLGEPAIGRRFKGTVWVQGLIELV